MTTDDEYLKKHRKRAARRLQQETGMKYTSALRQVISEEEPEQEQ